MKGLDTPVLLEILRGRKSGMRLLKDLQGEELATTELNLFELEAIARAGPRQGLDRRLAALDSLRRKLTVLPLDERASRLAAVRASGGTRRASPWESVLLGIAEANGCAEWITSKSARPGAVRGKLRIRIVAT